MLCHGIALRTTGVMAVLNQTHGNACGFRTHFCAIAIHVVEQPPFLINVSFGGHKRATVAEYVEMPDTAAVVFTEAVHPAKDTGLDKNPLRDTPEVQRPETQALFIGYQAGRNEGRHV